MLTLWILYFNGTIFPGNGLRNKRIFHAFRQAKLWHYGAFFLLRSPALLTAYDAKYDWSYDVEQYGLFTRVEPDFVMAWRAAGPAGRDGFRQAGRWRFPDPSLDL